MLVTNLLMILLQVSSRIDRDRAVAALTFTEAKEISGTPAQGINRSCPTITSFTLEFSGHRSAIILMLMVDVAELVRMKLILLFYETR